LRCKGKVDNDVYVTKLTNADPQLLVENRTFFESKGDEHKGLQELEEARKREAEIDEIFDQLSDEEEEEEVKPWSRSVANDLVPALHGRGDGHLR
jgi:hypothetical protein